MILMSTDFQNGCWADLTRAGAHYQLSRSGRNQFVQSNLTITVNRHVSSLKYLTAG